MSNATKTLSPYAISYLRFSSVIQGKGDSRTRQNASRDRWLESHPEIPLKREMNDLGLSAFSGKHGDDGDLHDGSSARRERQQVQTDRLGMGKATQRDSRRGEIDLESPLADLDPQGGEGVQGQREGREGSSPSIRACL